MADVLTKNTNAPIGKMGPEVSFKYLYKMTRCLSYMHSQSNSMSQDYFQQLQEFIYNYSRIESVLEAIKRYTPSNGQKLSSKNSVYVKNLIKKLKIEHPDVDDRYVKDKLVHYHFKPNGKQKEVIFGFNKENVFYIVDFDLYHEFDK